MNEVHTYHRPPEGIAGVYAFIRCEGFIDRFIIPASVVRKLNPNNECWDTLTDLINSGKEPHGIVFSWSDVSAVWSRLLPTGESIGVGQWFKYTPDQMDDFITAICIRGDNLIEDWCVPEFDWPWNSMRDHCLTEVFLELKNN